MVRLKFAIELKYEISDYASDFIFNIHAAQTGRYCQSDRLHRFATRQTDSRCPGFARKRCRRTANSRHFSRAAGTRQARIPVYVRYRTELPGAAGIMAGMHRRPFELV